MILNDHRIISLEEIIKQNSLLPPIVGVNKNPRFISNMPGQRHNNFALPSKRKQVQSIANNHYNAMIIQNNSSVLNSGYNRRRMNQNAIILKRNFNLPAVGQAQQSPSKSDLIQSKPLPLVLQSYNPNQVVQSKTNHVTGLRQSNSTQRILQQVTPIQKYPDLRRIQVGGGAIVANSGLSPQNTNLVRANFSPRDDISKPLYSRGQSKIGSGVIRPF